MRFVLRYTGLRVRDLDRSIRFYTEVMGLSLLRRVPAPETRGEFAIVGGGTSGHWLELNWYGADSPAAGPYREGDELDHVAFEVEDLDAALTYLESRGHPTVSYRRKSTSSEWAYVQDPDGIWIELFQHRPSP
ncbi:MAG TPA: VOC family protein [Thermoplasmata archaeon]|jgi:lactoylglutathione lyase